MILLRRYEVFTKRCSKCGEIKPESEFAKGRHNKDGLQCWCRSCNTENKRKHREEHPEAAAEYRRRYREANREAIAESQRRHREKHPEVVLESKRKYREANREAILEGQRRYREANREALAEKERRRRKEHPEISKEIQRKYRKEHPVARAEYQRKYREAHREYYAAWMRCRRAREAGNGGYYPMEHMEITWKVFGKECAYCGDTIGPFHLDHFVPIALGGPTTIENMVVTCARCNISKSAKPPQDWLAPEKYAEVRDILRGLVVTDQELMLSK